MPTTSSQSPHGHNIDPAIASGDIMSGSAESGGDDNLGDGRKSGKRELSQSKRAAQNRAAQVSRFLFARGVVALSRPPSGLADDENRAMRKFGRCNLVRWYRLLCQLSCHPHLYPSLRNVCINSEPSDNARKDTLRN